MVPCFRFFYLWIFGINLFVHAPTSEFSSHSCCHHCSILMLMTRFASTFSTPNSLLVSLLISARPRAFRCIGVRPATTRMAGVDTVRYAQATRMTIFLCGPSIICLWLRNIIEALQTGDAYNSWLSTTVANNCLLYCLGPPMFGISRERAAAVPAAFPLANIRCALNPSVELSSTPR